MYADGEGTGKTTYEKSDYPVLADTGGRMLRICPMACPIFDADTTPTTLDSGGGCGCRYRRGHGEGDGWRLG